jgi:outer membrane protein
MYKFRYFLLLPAVLVSVGSGAQDKWNLVKCVEYARANNITVRQTDLQAKFATLAMDQSKAAQLPTLGFNGNLAYGAGRNQDPTSFGLITTDYLSNSYSLQSGITIFNWFSRKNAIEASAYDLKAAEAAVDKTRDDISLNVATAYLQILLAKEQANLSKVQIGQTTAQLDNTRKRVNAGLLPELNAAELEAQLARDSSSYVTAEASVQQFILQMKALLNLDAAAPFEIETPPVERIPVLTLAELQPDAVYQLALANLPQQRVNDFRLKAAQKNVAVAKGAMNPTISGFASLGTRFNSESQEAKSITSFIAPIGKVTVGGTDYNVLPLQPFSQVSFGKISYFNQLNENFNQALGIGISVPLLNGKTLRTSYARSQLNVKTSELQIEADNQKLKQDIYRAYTDAMAALQKFSANKKTVETTAKAYEFAGKRYELNLLSTYDLINSQNNMLRAKIELLYAQYDYVFKMKLLEFYKGQGLKL